MTCPHADELSAFLFGRLADERYESVGAHLDECAECQDALVRFAEGGRRSLTQADTSASSSDFAQEPECEQAIALVSTFREACEADTTGFAAGDTGAGSPFELLPLDRVGPYQILERLGRGGMGVVYKALHTRLQREVAIKVLPGHYLDNEHAVARFDREMRTIGRVHHPNIVHASDAGEADGIHYLVMELVDGVDLAKLLRRSGVLPVRDACEIIRQAAAGLQHAHERGLVHRDIKPSNLMLAVSDRQSAVSKSPIVKILDLGLGLLMHDDEDDELTSTGMLMGTIDYMAPEQLEDTHGVDSRADIYSLGATLYKLLAGRAPHDGDRSRLEKMAAIARDEPPSVTELRRDVPPGLATIVHQMLAKQPEQRFDSPAEVARALQPFAERADLAGLYEGVAADGDKDANATTGPVAHPKNTGRKRTWVAIGGFLCVVLAIFAAIVVHRITTPYGKLLVHAAEGTNVEIDVQQHGKIVDILGPGNGWSVRVEAGMYKLALRTEDRELRLSDDMVVVSRDRQAVVTIVRRAADAGATQSQMSVRARPGRFVDSGQRLGNSISYAVRLGDIDGDRDLDAVVVNEMATRVWLNDGAVFHDSSQELTRWASELGDLDGDEDLDLLTYQEEGNRVWLNNGAGVFAATEQTLTSGGRILLGDLDGDNDLDAVIRATDCFVWLNDGRGRFHEGPQPSEASGFDDLALGDLDRDGDLDIFGIRFRDNRANSVLINNGLGEFRHGQQIGTNAAYICTELADLDGDGDLDAFVGSYHSGIQMPDYVWTNAGNGLFEEEPRMVGKSRGRSVALGDLDGDGDLDAVVSDEGMPSSVLWNNGSGEFESIGPPLGSGRSQFTALGDLDGDGDVDAFIGIGAGEELGNQVWLNEALSGS